MMKIVIIFVARLSLIRYQKRKLLKKWTYTCFKTICTAENNELRRLVIDCFDATRVVPSHVSSFVLDPLMCAACNYNISTVRNKSLGVRHYPGGDFDPISREEGDSKYQRLPRVYTTRSKMKTKIGRVNISLSSKYINFSILIIKR